MKGFVFKNLVVASIIVFAATTGVVTAKSSHPANHISKHEKWTCKTNASSSSQASDKKADDEMTKAKNAKSAFTFAFNHCRDCSEITCSADTSAQSSSTTSTSNTSNDGTEKTT